MRRASLVMEKKKNKTSVSLKTSQRQKDENIPKYNELNQDINKLIRTINMQFDFKNFKKEKLISLKEVSIVLDTLK